MTREEATTKLKWFLENNLIEDISGCEGLEEAINMAIKALEQPELIEHSAYIRGFEQGRTQGMIDAQGGKNMIKAEWTNADTLDLQPTCNQLATDCISRQAAISLVHKNYDTILDFKSDGRTVADSFEDIINTLPPAQPEIIRCRNCKYAHLTYDGDCKGCDKWLDEEGFHLDLYLDGDFYCGYAERKEG